MRTTAITIEKLDAHLRHTKAKLAGFEKELLTLKFSRRPEDQTRASVIKKHRLHLEDQIKRLEEQISAMVGTSTYTRPALA